MRSGKVYWRFWLVGTLLLFFCFSFVTILSFPPPALLFFVHSNILCHGKPPCLVKLFFPLFASDICFFSFNIFFSTCGAYFILLSLSSYFSNLPLTAFRLSLSNSLLVYHFLFYSISFSLSLYIFFLSCFSGCIYVLQSDVCFILFYLFIYFSFLYAHPLLSFS